MWGVSYLVIYALFILACIIWWRRSADHQRPNAFILCRRDRRYLVSSRCDFGHFMEREIESRDVAIIRRCQTCGNQYGLKFRPKDERRILA